MNFIHTATHRVHIFQMIVLKKVFKFVNDNDIDTLQTVSFCLIYCGQRKHVLLVRVSSTSTSHLWEWDNSCAVCERGIRFASVSALALELSGMLSWASTCYLPGWLLNNVVVFWKLFYWDDVLLAVRQRLLFHQDSAAAHYIWQWLNATNSQMLNGRQGPIAWPPLLLNLTPKVFSCGDTWRSTFS
jgi:hypothetical protein